MPKPRQYRASLRQAERFDFTVKIVRAMPGGKFESSGEFNCGSPADARDAADRLQREFDADADPCRSYVYKNGDSIPVYAGLQIDVRRGYLGNR
jgi:hypothetical protein